MDEAQLVAFWKQHKAGWDKNHGADMVGQGIIEVIAPGRVSGSERSVLLTSLETDKGWIVAASNIGRATDPNWWQNLVANGNRGQVRPAGGDPVDVEAVELQGEDRQQAWDRMVTASAMYKDYEAATANIRVIPVVELRRVVR